MSAVRPLAAAGPLPALRRAPGMERAGAAAQGEGPGVRGVRGALGVRAAQGPCGEGGGCGVSGGAGGDGEQWLRGGGGASGGAVGEGGTLWGRDVADPPGGHPAGYGRGVTCGAPAVTEAMASARWGGGGPGVLGWGWPCLGGGWAAAGTAGGTWGALGVRVLGTHGLGALARLGRAGGVEGLELCLGDRGHPGVQRQGKGAAWGAEGWRWGDTGVPPGPWG